MYTCMYTYIYIYTHTYIYIYISFERLHVGVRRAALARERPELLRDLAAADILSCRRMFA